MKERPILFNAEMVRAVLDGRKTQTRRIAKVEACDTRPLGGGRVFITPTGFYVPRTPEDHASYCPYGQPGDRLWVRESWRVGAWNESDGKIAVDYRADNHARREWLDPNPDDDGELFNRLWEQSSEDCSGRVRPDDEGRYQWKASESPCRWRPSIFMPRAFSRITLEITSVRVERVQAINSNDARAEGINRPIDARYPVVEFRALWDSINAGRGYGWEVNPWVWVIEFKTVHQGEHDEH